MSGNEGRHGLRREAAGGVHCEEHRFRRHDEEAVGGEGDAEGEAKPLGDVMCAIDWMTRAATTTSARTLNPGKVNRLLVMTWPARDVPRSPRPPQGA